MTKLKLIDAKTLEKTLFRLGFVKLRQKGSHAFYRHPDGRYTTIPHHSGRKIARPLLYTILKEIGLSVEDYNKVLKER